MTTPTAHQIAVTDQIDAAARDARKALEGAALAGRGHLIAAPPGSWLHDQGHVMHEALATRRVRVCPHVKSGPRVLHAAVWAPGVLVCPACTPLLVPDRKEDQTCDRCRKTAGYMLTGLTAFGPIILGYGLCYPCAASASTPAC